MQGVFVVNFYRNLFKICLAFGLFFLNSEALSVNFKLSKLKNGCVIQKSIKGISLSSSKSINGSECMILIDASVEKVWEALDDKKNLPKFIHQIKEVEIIQNNEKKELVKTSVKLCRMLPKFDYVLSFDKSKKYRKMKFKKIDGCFKELFGSFEFISYGKSTILGYRIYSDPGFFIPEFVCKGLRSDAEDFMMAIKKEAEKQQ